VKRVCTFIVKTQPVDRIHRIELDLPAVNKITQRTDQRLPFQFPLVTRARRKSQQRCAPMSVHHHTQFQPQAMRIPPMRFLFHHTPFTQFWRSVSMPAAPARCNSAAAAA
jgi:hypothetical protein